MAQKCLILYASNTGNTEKVALRFKSSFEKHGWECDVFKCDRKTDIHHLPFNLEDYDFLCAGSGVILHTPYNELLMVIRKLIYGEDPRPMLRNRGEEIIYMKDPIPEIPREKRPSHRKIYLTDTKHAAVFITYAGYEFGPKEAVPALQLLALEIEHLGYRCIGQFCCPGRFINGPTPQTYHGDIRNRPDERDLLKAEMFIEDRLEEIRRMPD